MRPSAVIQAEALYGAAIALLLVSAAITWGPLADAFGFGITLGGTAFVVGLYVLLTLWTTRRGGRTARWLLVAATAYAVLMLAWQIAGGQLASGWLGLLNVSQAVLMLLGAVLLFRPAANAWFAAPRDGDDEAIGEEERPT